MERSKASNLATGIVSNGQLSFQASFRVWLSLFRKLQNPDGEMTTAIAIPDQVISRLVRLCLH